MIKYCVTLGLSTENGKVNVRLWDLSTENDKVNVPLWDLSTENDKVLCDFRT